MPIHEDTPFTFACAMNREVIRTNSFANEAADFVLANARHALAQRGGCTGAAKGAAQRRLQGWIVKRLYRRLFHKSLFRQYLPAQT